MRLPLLLFFFLSSITLYSQISSVSYICSLDLKYDDPEEGLNKLYFSGNESVYVFEEWPEKNRFEQSGTVISYVPYDTEGAPIYTNLSTGEQVYKTFYFAPKGRFWILTEKIPAIDWQITNQKNNFSGLTAFFATGTYGGREYEVWFTPDIPLPLGPHRLNGLPGLILEAKSTDGKVSFTFSGYQPVEQEGIVIAPPKEGVVISRKMLEKYLIQKLLKTEANSPPEWNDTIDDPPADYEIEKRKWTVFSKYKRERLRKNGGG